LFRLLNFIVLWTVLRGVGYGGGGVRRVPGEPGSEIGGVMGATRGK